MVAPTEMAEISTPEGLAKVAVLVSGGLDSALLIQEGLDRGLEVHPLYLSVGFCWETAERHWLGRLLERLAHPRLAPLEVLSNPLDSLFPGHWAFTGRKVPDAASRDEAVYLPARNLLLLTEAAVFAQARRLEEIWIGVLSANPFGDGQEEFFQSFAATCGLGLPRPLRIAAPFQSLAKSELVARHPRFPYELTFSCIQPRGVEPCGACNKCEERRKAFRELALTTPRA